MRLFDDSIVAALNSLTRDNEVTFVGLGKHDFQLGLDHLHIQAERRVEFMIGGVRTAWDEGPSDAQVWRMIGARPERFELEAPSRLRMILNNGDSIIFVTDEGPYETVTINISGRGHEFF